jgi:hypothetical protein
MAPHATRHAVAYHRRSRGADRCSLSAERAAVLPTLAKLIAEQFDAQREHYKSELRELERELQLSISRLEASVSAL